MAVPKRRTSRWRRNQRRAQAFFARLKSASIVKCPNCGEFMKPHRACPYCGHYRERQVLEV